ncbi:50S ribosomal protein L21 [Candidatus Ornithobacterium hominis]|uniref:50S ribosomal protein L21 n=1 Tax=Candidatus Ornithobacterium hominis TaxID=2497989 RepID=UPI000E5AE153|nr:50S ribosomal protein L21 [Candidatus Ornithobacterium hominis]SZD73637.1 50S ribosomal protein L21 [Candidatus Ornithobacterium hominis]
MYAIVEIAGLQYKVEQDQQLYVNRLKGNEGDSLTFDKVLLTDNGNITVGAPAIENMTVEAKILEHVKGDKVIIFKKKRRKGYQKKNGFRAALTKIEIISIGGNREEKKESKKIAEPKKSASKNDKLTKIEGIGPKVQELLNESNIYTFSDLANSKAEDIKAILEPKGGIYAAMDPTTWPEQAQLAADGKFDELNAFQEKLNGGRK